MQGSCALAHPPASQPPCQPASQPASQRRWEPACWRQQVGARTLCCLEVARTRYLSMIHYEYGLGSAAHGQQQASSGGAAARHRLFQ
jgi:hypothetical protein